MGLQITPAVGLGFGLCVGLAIGTGTRVLSAFFWKGFGKTPPRVPSTCPLESSDEEEEFTDDGNYKMVLVVRTDLKMGKGKIAAQCAHAALGAYKKALRHDPVSLAAWESSGQTKIAVKVNSEEALFELQAHASIVKLTSCVIRDAGRTQIAAGSVTVLAVGPGPVSLVDKVTHHLKLM